MFPSSPKPFTHSIFINQAHYIADILKWFNMDAANMISTHANPYVQKESRALDARPIENKVLKNIKKYHQINQTKTLSYL